MSTPNPTAVGNIADKLIETLDEEIEVLVEMEAAFAEQLEAVRSRDRDRLEEAALETNDLSARLQRLQATHTRQLRLLARVSGMDGYEGASLRPVIDLLDGVETTRAVASDLAHKRETIHERTRACRKLGDQVEYALQYAVALGQEIVRTLRGVGERPTPQGYTADGRNTATPGSSGLVDQVG